MRIARLHIRAYGHFTDYSIDFGPKAVLHLIYGENEAGKSTTLRALSSVLFGYPHELIDAFQHDAKDIAIGVELIANNGDHLSFVRKRRGKNALAETDGKTLEESRVASYLGGVSQEAFEKVFALDHLRLREHARSLLLEGGSLGFSLAEAGSGISGLKAVLDSLKDERSMLFLPGGSKPKLNQMISKLTELRKEARRRTISPYEYNKAQKQIEQVETSLGDLREKKKTVQSNIRKLERIARNLPLRAEHDALTRKIEELSGVPLLPPENTVKRVKAQADHDAAQLELGTSQEAIHALKTQIAAIVIDDRSLARRQDIERLAQQRAVIESADKDLPKRQYEREQHYNTAADLLAKAELDGNPKSLSGILPSVLKRKRISSLADEGKKLYAQRTTAADNVENAASDLKAAEEKAALAPKPLDASDLSRTLVAADKLGDISNEIFRRTRALERKNKSLAERIAGLGIADRTASTLRELVVPPEKTVFRYQESLLNLDKEIEASRVTIERLEKEISDLENQIATITTAGDVATEDEIHAARRMRDEGWALVRGVYIDKQRGLEARAKAFAADGRIAEAYESHVNTADHVADVVRDHVEEATALSMLKSRMAELATQAGGEHGKSELLENRRKQLFSEWLALWPAGIVTHQLPGEMIEWLKLRQAALTETVELDEEHDQIAELSKREHETVGLLAGVLRAFTDVAPEDGLDKLRDSARKILSDIEKANTRHTKTDEAKRTQQDRKAQAEKALIKLDAKIAEWTEKWRPALTEAGLAANLSIESASAILDVMNSLDNLKLQIDDLSHRINTMEQNKESFARAVDELRSLFPEASQLNSVEICKQIESKLETAKSDKAAVEKLQAQLDIRSTAHTQAQDKLSQSETVLQRLCKDAVCSKPEELPELERQSTEKQQALRDRVKLETRIREDGAGLDLTALFAECEGVVGDQIAGEISDLKGDEDEIDKRVEELMSSRATLKSDFERLLEQNQAADLMQEAANVEAEIADTVESYVDLTVQETLLRQAVDLYRDRNQGPIVKRAKGLFVELTDGVYMGLRADMDAKGEPILIAEHRTRGSLDVPALSDGTVDPLYLSLRFAVIQEHNATHEPLPFIADDLLLNLDDKRAKAALRTLAQIAVSSQVLFFTHHAHMIELAREAVPKTILVEHQLSTKIEPT